MFCFSGLQEFSELDSAEVNDFRFKMRKLGDDIAQSRTKLTWQQRLFYQFPPRLSAVSTSLQDAVSQYFPNGNIVIASKFENNDVSVPIIFFYFFNLHLRSSRYKFIISGST